MATNLELTSEPDEGKSIWLQTMSECLDSSSTKLPHNKRLLVLGDDEAEKTRLVTKLQGWPLEDNIRKGNGLEYRFLNVRDEYCENQTRLGVWILDGDPCFQPLLKYVLDSNTLSDTTVLLLASMTRPWDIFRTINTWVNLLQKHIENLDIPSSVLEERKKRVLERYREYIEPGLSIYGSLPTENPREIAVNLGVEVIVIVTRTEYMKVLQTDFGYENEHFDFIQFSLREFCLLHGAALCYISVKEDKNCDLLLKYVLHKIYAFPFRIPAIFLERDSVFVPAGWDNENKIRFLSDAMITIPLSMPFEDVVFQPGRLSDAKGSTPEVVSSDEQEFLLTMQTALARQAAESSLSESSKEMSSMTAEVVQRNVARRVARSQGPRAMQKKPEPNFTTVEGDTVLQSFFKNLLNRRTSAPVSRPADFSGNRTYDPKETAGSSRHAVGVNGYEERQDTCLHKNISSSAQQTERSVGGCTSKLMFMNKKCDHAEGDVNHSFKNTLHLSLDQDKDNFHLPEYFLSNQGDSCVSDCCFKENSSMDSIDDEDDFDPPLDRVRSSFNPPLKLLLEKPGDGKEGSTSSTAKQNGDVSNIKCSMESEEIPPPSESVATDSVIDTMPCVEGSSNKQSVDKQ